ncbi:MAG: universal stress protein [Gammaproteobacteria bacterium]
MKPLNNVLLASHGTNGAKAAEQYAIQMCQEGATIKHLIVVPSLWEGMTGDDWLNNGSTRDTYCRYLESELGKEVDEHCERINKSASEHNIHYSHEIVVGEPEECLINLTKEIDFDLIVMGSKRPKGVTGLRSRMKAEKITKSIKVPLVIVPYPEAEKEH